MMKETSPLERRRLASERFSSARPAVFLDRDGVLIEDKHYLKDPNLVELCAGSKTLLKCAYDSGWPVIIITNQSGIERDFFNWSDYERVTDRLLSLLDDERHIAAIYANGYAPGSAVHSWRKPNPGMLEAAAHELNIDLTRSVLAGDRLSDLIAADRAGLRRLCHVKTGHGRLERESVKAWSSGKRLDLAFCDDLLGFTDAFETWIG